MSNSYIDEPMLEAYMYETNQIVETLETVLINSEKENAFSQEHINEIFRFMHTIKGSSAMMMFKNISELAHKVEDVFFVIREDISIPYDFSQLVDLCLESVDFFKIELMKIRNGEAVDGDHTLLVEALMDYLAVIKPETKGKAKKPKETKDVPPAKQQKYYIRQSPKVDNNLNYYEANIHFDEGCEMENIRAYTIVHNIVNLVEEIQYSPNDIIDNDESVDIIKKNGFRLMVKTKEGQSDIEAYLNKTLFLKTLDFKEINQDVYNAFVLDHVETEIKEDIKVPETSKMYQKKEKKVAEATTTTAQTIISVNVDKLDKLMDMVGELVIAEAMVTQNPDVMGLEIESFDKASRQLHKITREMQDMVMAIRMVPLSTTFMKMHRIVRDMSKKLKKNVELVVVGEETEVDKNIIEKMSDPLMHIIRNAIDHGIESEEERLQAGKKQNGRVILEAKNSGSDVLIIIKDDGKGLDKERIYDKALRQGLVNRSMDEMSDREIFNMILTPGFSTKEVVTEFSGRGVGMDVVSKNIESIGGAIIVDSELGRGTTITLKIPLTLAIIEGMNIRVGDTCFTIPIVSIQESFRPKTKEVFMDTDDNEMIMVRGQCYPIIKLYDHYDISNAIKDYEEGILIMVNENERSSCIFADELIGQQQVVVKALPEYVKKCKKIDGLGGCTLLGDGSISLILDVGDLNNANLVDTR